MARVELQADDAAVIIASDGLWDVVTDQEASDIVRDVLEVRLGRALLFFCALAPTAQSEHNTVVFRRSGAHDWYGISLSPIMLLCS